MGDILCAHLEILQKEDESKEAQANIENMPSNYSESFERGQSMGQPNRTYTQLDSNTTSVTSSAPPPPPLLPSTSTAMAIAAAQSQSSTPASTYNRTTSNYTPTSQVQHQGLYNPPMLMSSPLPGVQQQDWNQGSTAGSVVDTSSEYSYQGGIPEMKYSHQIAQLANGRVPATHYYPSYPGQDQFDDSLWQSQQQYDPSWHQPTVSTSEFHSEQTTVSGSSRIMTTLNPTSTVLSTTSVTSSSVTSHHQTTTGVVQSPRDPRISKYAPTSCIFASKLLLY